MKHRFVELYGLTAALASDQTITIDLNMRSPISQLIIDSRVLNGAQASSTDHPLAGLTKVEIVDGSDVLFSLDGFELQALDIYDSGIHPRGGWFNYLPGTETDAQVAMSFGRYLWDEILAFDPGKFLNPQLKITIDEDGGGMNSSGMKLSVLAAMFDEVPPSPTGFLMTKELKRWTKTAAGHEYTDCPLDYPYRKLFLQSRYAGSPPHWCFSNIKLSSDQDKKVILNGEFRDLMFGIGRENAFIKELLTSGAQAAKKIGHCTPTMDVMGTANQWRDDSAGGAIGTYNGDGGQYEWRSEQAHNAVHHIQGWAPHGTLCIPFGKQGIIEDWFDVKKDIGSLVLDATSGVTLATQKLFIQQMRTYAG